MARNSFLRASASASFRAAASLSQKGGLRPLPLGDFPLITLDVAGDRALARATAAKLAPRPTRDRRQQRHRLPGDRRATRPEHSQAARLRRKTEQPPARRCSLERDRREAGAGGNTMLKITTQIHKQPSASKTSEACCQADQDGACRRAKTALPRNSPRSKVLMMSVQKRRLPCRG